MISKVKIIIGVAAIALAMALSGYIYVLNSAINKYKWEAIKYEQNSKFYEDQFSKEQGRNIALQLTVDELADSKDSIIIEMNKFKRKYKAWKKDKPGDVNITAGATINVSDTLPIENKDNFKLDTVVVFNDMTKSYIKIDSLGLQNSLDIGFKLDFVIGTRLEYKNERKNWLDRLVHLDYKRMSVVRYNYEFTNDAIKPKDIRVIVVDDDN